MKPPATLSGQPDYSNSVCQILDVATPLFAEHGFNGVTTRQVAAAAGLNISTVHHHVGAKSALYRKILERMYAEEAAIFRAFAGKLDSEPIASAEALRDALFGLLDEMLDLMVSNTSRARLYVRRWLAADDEEHDDLSAAHGRELQDLLERILARGRTLGLMPATADPALLVRSFDWLVLGYFATGPTGERQWRDDPYDARNLERFRCFLRQYLCRMLELPEAPEAPANPTEGSRE
ncbi:MAG: TetR family transcriptional regulator [Candidatus Hydrogenedens sp.]|nr:TetR family transcriptional regulator [Candidatus Hydrogenedens sp.]